MLHKKIIGSIAIFSWLFCLFSCNPNVEIPSYLYIDSVQFTSLYDEQGSSSHRISDIRVVVNGDDRGSYEFPATVPVLHTGNSNIQLWAVVYKNGLRQQRVVNYFYNYYETTRTLRAKQIDTIYPVFSYSDLTKFDFIEDFESAGHKFSSIGKSLETTNDSLLLLHIKNEKNNFAGIICFDETDTNRYFEMQTISPVYLTGLSSTLCFLEFNCNSSQNLEVGVYIYNSSHSTSRQINVANVNATTDRSSWRKLYINLSESLSGMSSQETYFKVYIKGYAGTNCKDTFLFDNIKLIHL